MHFLFLSSPHQIRMKEEKEILEHFAGVVSNLNFQSLFICDLVKFWVWKSTLLNLRSQLICITSKCITSFQGQNSRPWIYVLVLKDQKYVWICNLSYSMQSTFESIHSAHQGGNKFSMIDIKLNACNSFFISLVHHAQYSYFQRGFYSHNRGKLLFFCSFEFTFHGGTYSYYLQVIIS